MSADIPVVDGLADLLDAGLIDEVICEVKSGKEAAVYCCRAHSTSGEQGKLLAAKVYRELSSRGFRNSAVYQGGRIHLAREGRAKRAAENRSAFGQKMEQALWIDHEWSMLQRLSDAGLNVPQPIARGERAILMPFLGDERGPSPMLHEIDLACESDSPGDVVDQLLWTIERMLDLHVVHGDLSPFNIMWHSGGPIIIDLPQAVDPRLNQAAHALLSRDVVRICEWAQRMGVRRDAAAFTAELWHRFTLGEIG